MRSKKTNFSKFLKENIPLNTIPSNKKILITGSSGFIGRYLVQCLVEIFKEKKLKVYGIDRIGPNIINNNYQFFKKRFIQTK